MKALRASCFGGPERLLLRATRSVLGRDHAMLAPEAPRASTRIRIGFDFATHGRIQTSKSVETSL